MVFVVNRARRGVGNRGLSSRRISQLDVVMKEAAIYTHLASLSMRKFCDRSATRLAVGEDPWTPLALK